MEDYCKLNKTLDDMTALLKQHGEQLQVFHNPQWMEIMGKLSSLTTTGGEQVAEIGAGVSTHNATPGGGGDDVFPSMDNTNTIKAPPEDGTNEASHNIIALLHQRLEIFTGGRNKSISDFLTTITRISESNKLSKSEILTIIKDNTGGLAKEVVNDSLMHGDISLQALYDRLMFRFEHRMSYDEARKQLEEKINDSNPDIFVAMMDIKLCLNKFEPGATSKNYKRIVEEYERLYKRNGLYNQTAFRLRELINNMSGASGRDDKIIYKAYGKLAKEFRTELNALLRYKRSQKEGNKKKYNPYYTNKPDSTNKEAEKVDKIEEKRPTSSQDPDCPVCKNLARSVKANYFNQNCHKELGAKRMTHYKEGYCFIYGISIQTNVKPCNMCTVKIKFTPATPGLWWKSAERHEGRHPKQITTEYLGK